MAEKSIFISHGEPKQLLVDDLFLSIKQEKKKLKKTTSLLDTISDFLRIFQIDEYKRKLNQYERLLENSKISRTDFSYNYSCSDEDLFNAIRRKYCNESLLQRGITVLRELLIDDDDEKTKEFKEIEKVLELQGLFGSSTNVWEEVYNSLSEISEYRERITNSIQKTQKLIGYYLRRKYKILGRDIRQCYRNIVRFKFKNMDDQSGDDNNLFSKKNRESNFIILNYFKHGTGFNYRRDKSYT